MAEDSIDIWNGLPLAAGSLDPQGLYLYDDGFRFVLWFGRMLSPDILNNLLGENFAADFSKVNLLTTITVENVEVLSNCYNTKDEFDD